MIAVTALGYDAYLTGWKDYIWYYSDWSSMFTLLTVISISYAYFIPTYTSSYDYFISSLFEVTLPLNMVVTLMYWGAYFTPSMLNWSDPDTYARPFLLHVLPLVVMLIEWSLNNIQFNYYYTFLYLIYIYLCYIPLTYIGKDFLGFYAYSFINYNMDSFSAFIWTPIYLGAVFFMHIGFYWATAIPTNFIKAHMGSGNPTLHEEVKVDFSHSFEDILSAF